MSPKEDIRITGLREKPTQNEPEQTYHMTSVLRRLFPDIVWRQSVELVDLEGHIVKNPSGRSYKPDFLSIALKMIIEIDGFGKGRQGGHFIDVTTTHNDYEKKAKYESLGYKVIQIPSYIQLDRTMVHHYFDLDYDELLYPAAGQHGFAHPDIALPISFCYEGKTRFEKDLNEIPGTVKNKIIDTLVNRIKEYEIEGFSTEDARAKVLPPSLFYLLKGTHYRV